MSYKSKIKWSKKSNHQELIDDIKGSMSLTDGNEVDLKPGCNLLIDILSDNVDHSYPFSHEAFHNLFKALLIDQFKKDKLENITEIISSLEEKCEERNLIENEYILVTSVNLKNNYILKPRTVNGGEVSFFNSVPEKYAKVRQRLRNGSNLSKRSDYQFCTVSVTAPDAITGCIKAAQSLDIIRALMQVGVKKNRNILAFNEEHEYPAESIITLGKFNSLHHPSGEAEEDQVWIDRRYQEKETINIRKLKTTQDDLRKLIQDLESTTFKEHVSKALISYIDALDQKNNGDNSRFLKLWSVLEQLVGSDKSKEIRSRISFFSAKRKSTESILKTLRRARNKHVHEGVAPKNMQMKNILLCQCIEFLISFFLRNPFKLKDFESAKEFMSASSDIEEIDKKIQTLKGVKQFISGS